VRFLFIWQRKRENKAEEVSQQHAELVSSPAPWGTSIGCTHVAVSTLILCTGRVDSEDFVCIRKHAESPSPRLTSPESARLTHSVSCLLLKSLPGWFPSSQRLVDCLVRLPLTPFLTWESSKAAKQRLAQSQLRTEKPQRHLGHQRTQAGGLSAPHTLPEQQRPSLPGVAHSHFCPLYGRRAAEPSFSVTHQEEHRNSMVLH